MASWNIRNSLNWCWGVRLKKIIWSLSFLWWNLCLFSITNINHESHQGNSVHSSRREARVDFTLQMVTHLSRSVNYSPRHHASCNTRTRGTLTRCHIRQLNHPVPSTKKNCSLWHYFHLDYSTVIILMLFLFLLFWGKGGGGVVYRSLLAEIFRARKWTALRRFNHSHSDTLFFQRNLTSVHIFFPGHHYHNTFSISESQNQSTESLFFLIQMCFWSPCLIFLCMYACMYSSICCLDWEKKKDRCTVVVNPYRFKEADKYSMTLCYRHLDYSDLPV